MIIFPITTQLAKFCHSSCWKCESDKYVQRHSKINRNLMKKNLLERLHSVRGWSRADLRLFYQFLDTWFGCPKPRKTNTMECATNPWAMYQCGGSWGLSLWVFPGYKISPQGFFLCSRFFLVGILWVQNLFLWVFCGLEIFSWGYFCRSKIFNCGLYCGSKICSCEYFAGNLWTPYLNINEEYK